MSDLQLEIREALEACNVLERMWPYNHHHPEETAGAIDHLRHVRTALTRAGEEIERLQGAFEALYDPGNGFGHEFEDLFSLEVIVPVPADQAFKDQWGDDEETMYVFAWHANRYLAASEETDDE